jgi:uncharacterized protein (TIRG00374 family)
VLFWGLPVIILFFVFRQIDFAELKAHILRTNLAWFSFGVGMYSFTILIAALRWYVLLRQNLSRNVPLGFVVKHFWIGLALGTFAPGQIGADVYRALASTRRFGHLGLNVSIVLVQKLLTLMTCMALIILLYPVVSVSFPPEIDRIHQLSYIMFLGTAVLIAVTAIALRSRLLSLVETRLETYLANLRRRTADMLDLETQEQDASIPLRSVLKPWGDPRQLLPGLAFSIVFMLVAAARGQIFFRALGYDLPFAFNLFASPVLVFVFTLPISFGSLGIREAAFILVYGLFGVPAEIALSVSFFNLFGILLNSLIGGVVLLVSNARIRDGSVIVSRDLLPATDQFANEDPEHAD